MQSRSPFGIELCARFAAHEPNVPIAIERRRSFAGRNHRYRHCLVGLDWANRLDYPIALPELRGLMAEQVLLDCHRHRRRSRANVQLVEQPRNVTLGSARTDEE